MSRINATLVHDAKRVYVYSYGVEGKITISKRLLDNTEIDYIDAIENRDVEIENSKENTSYIEFSGIQVDSKALEVLADILDYFDSNNQMPAQI